MHHDVVVGLTGVQAEYIRGLLNAEADDVCAEMGGQTTSKHSGTESSDLEECWAMCELLIQKFDSAISEGIAKNLYDQRRA